MNITDKLTITCEDNMQLMARYPDKHFDLAIVDPPYGINQNGGKSIGLRKKWKTSYEKEKHLIKEWDVTPDQSFFNELERVSKKRIIWGYNYFSLPPTKGIIAWDKVCDGTDFSHFELAWSNFEKSARIFRLPIQTESQRRIHPTQKPVQLYKWLLDKYAKEGDKILDTHLGSASLALACHDNGFELTACELDEDYYNAAIERVKNHVSQLSIFQ